MNRPAFDPSVTSVLQADRPLSPIRAGAEAVAYASEPRDRQSRATVVPVLGGLLNARESGRTRTMPHVDTRGNEIYDRLQADFGTVNPKAFGYLSEYSFFRERKQASP